ncbi:MAG: AtpZ/AtpI family protein [Syntrophus sp. (in: bacteria)]
MTAIQKTQKPLYNQYHHIMAISAWGFVIAFASFLFLYIGFKIDQYFGTAPNFMFGMFFLALFLTIGRLYQEAWKRRKEV